MDEETKSCPNCKREIPAVNFTIHSVHCARNIKVCPVCKEPVPGSELDDHHQKMHKLLPCKQCGESVCGTDLEDHIRDSCANTVKSCRFCELELPRREIPAHEGYCGVRTEQCTACKEWVMIKYRQLHEESNHGFIRLDDDPAPTKKEPPKLNNRPLTNIHQRILDSTHVPVKLPTPFESININNPINRKSTTSHNENSPYNARSGANEPAFSRPSTSNGGNIPGSSKPDYSAPISPQSNSRQGLANYNQRVSNSNQGLTHSNQGVSNSSQGPSNSIQGVSNFNQGASSRHSVSNFNQGVSNSSQEVSNSGQGVSNSNQKVSNSNQKVSNSRQSVSSRPDSSDSGLISSNTGPNSNTHFNSRQGVSRPDSSTGSWPDSSTNRPNSIGFNSDDPISRPDSSRPHNALDIAGHSRARDVRSQGSSNNGSGASNLSPQEATGGGRASNGVKKRTNDQPQINMDTSATKTVDKDLGARGVSRGAVKKRPAPAPPRLARRDQPYYSATMRLQQQERERAEQNQYNLAHGLPPVLNPLQKIEKLRKMDALHNRELEEPPRPRRARDAPSRGAEAREPPATDLDDATRLQFMNLKPMSPTQFMQRFSSLQVSPPASDRFPEIKSSLRELRRGLNEVTAPYNSNNNNAIIVNDNDRVRPVSPREDSEEVQLPCEFCNMLVPAEDIVQHQTGCRPDLAQLVVGAAPRPRRAPRPPRAPLDPLDPLIPCEFCAESLPVYLITEHQERCIREHNMLV